MIQGVRTTHGRTTGEPRRIRLGDHTIGVICIFTEDGEDLTYLGLFFFFFLSFFSVFFFKYRGYFSTEEAKVHFYPTFVSLFCLPHFFLFFFFLFSFFRLHEI